MPGRITMRDVARSLGLDPSTVSLALRGSPRIPLVTKQRIRRAAEALGYSPDPMLRALANYRRSRTPLPISAELAWINRWTPPERYHAFREFDGYWRGAAAAALDAGYRLERFHPGDAPLDRLERMLHARGIGGLVLPPHHGAPNDWDGLDLSRFTVVRIGHSVPVPAHAVGCDQTGAGMLGFSRIHALGYRRIGFVTHPGAELSSRFHAGFLFAREQAPEATHPPSLVLSETVGADERERLRRWLGRHRPDALFTTHAGLRRLLGELGLRVPADIALAATSVLDGDAEAGIDQRAPEIGRAAVELLDGLLALGRSGPPPVPRMTTVQPRWVDGASLPPRPTRPEQAATARAFVG